MHPSLVAWITGIPARRRLRQKGHKARDKFVAVVAVAMGGTGNRVMSNNKVLNAE